MERSGPDLLELGGTGGHFCFILSSLGGSWRDSGKKCDMIGCWLSSITLASRDENKVWRKSAHVDRPVRGLMRCPSER